MLNESNSLLVTVGHNYRQMGLQIALGLIIMIGAVYMVGMFENAIRESMQPIDQQEQAEWNTWSPQTRQDGAAFIGFDGLINGLVLFGRVALWGMIIIAILLPAILGYIRWKRFDLSTEG